MKWLYRALFLICCNSAWAFPGIGAPPLNGGTNGAAILVPSPLWAGVTGCGGACSPPAVDASIQGSGFGETVVGNFDDYQNVVVENNGTHAITVGAAILNRAWIRKVVFFLEGNSATVTRQTVNPRTGSKGWTVIIQSSRTYNGDATLYADIYPVNGYVRRVSLPTWLNSNPTGSGYVNRVTGALYANALTGVDPATCADAGTVNGILANPYATLKFLLNCSTSGNYAYVETGAGQIYNDGASGACVGGVCKANSRIIEVKPRTAGAYSIGLTARGQWNLTAQNVVISDATVDMATVQLVQPCAGGTCSASTSTVIFQRSALTDSNGLSYWTSTGYYAGTTATMSQVPFVNSLNRYVGLVESTVSTINICGPKLIRNVTGTVPWDTNFQSANSVNSRFFNVSVAQPLSGGVFQELHQRMTIETATPIAGAAVYNGGTNQTTFTITSAEVSGLVSGGQVDFLSGALIGQTFPMVSFTTATRVVVVTGDASAAVAADSTRLWQPAHADANQMGILATGAANTDLNFYAQSYKAIGVYQPFFNQPGGYLGSGNVTSSGLTAIFSASFTTVINDFLHVNAGANQFQTRKITAVASPTQVTIASAFSPDIAAGVQWLQGKSNVNFICVSCILGGTNSQIAALAQFQQGMIHYGCIQCTFWSTSMFFRSGNTATTGGGQAGAFGSENSGFFDTLLGDHGDAFGSIFSDSPPGFSNILGLLFSGLQYTSALSSPGTDITAASVTLIAADPTSSYKPTAGLTQIMKGVQGGVVPDGTPLFPWSYSGTLIGIGSLVGAQQP